MPSRSGKPRHPKARPYTGKREKVAVSTAAWERAFHLLNEPAHRKFIFARIKSEGFSPAKEWIEMILPQLARTVAAKPELTGDDLYRYLTRAIRFQYIDQVIKKASREPAVELKPHIDLIDSQALGRRQKAQEEHHNVHRLGRIYKLLPRLSRADSDLFRYRYEDELSHEQIAHKMGMTPNTVGVRLHRLIKSLQNMLRIKSK